MKSKFRKILKYANIIQRSDLNERLGMLCYKCNICGNVSKSRIDDLEREKPSCLVCGSTVRMRSIAYAVSLVLFNKGISIPDMPQRPEIEIIGLSDWEGYAEKFARKFSYKNTYYHQTPKLDITNIESTMEGISDLLISSDVFEHVEPPVSRAFINSYNLLKDTGALILTVPYNCEGETIEHFPDLHKYEITDYDGCKILCNTTANGCKQKFDGLLYHGGQGDTLEMRVFSKQGLLNELETAGFNNISILSDPIFDFGIYYKNSWSLPIIAMKN